MPSFGSFATTGLSGAGGLGTQIGTAFVAVTTDTSGLKRGLAEAQAMTTAAGRNLATSGVVMQGVGASLSKNVSIPLLAAAGASAKMASDFDTAMKKTSALAAVPQKNLADLRQKVLDLSGATAQSPMDLADSLYFVASAGLKASQVFPIVSLAAKGAMTGMADAGTLGQLLVNTLNAYGKAAPTAAHAMDVLTAAIRVGVAEPADLASSLGTVIPVASQMGVSFDQVAGAIAAATNEGISAARAATGLRYMMISLESPTAVAEESLKKYGLTADDVANQLGTPVAQGGGLLNTLKTLADTFDLTDVAGRQAFFHVLGGVRAGHIALALVGNDFSRVSDVMDATARAATGAGDQFEKAAAQMKQTPGVQIQLAWNEVKLAAIDAGEAILPVVISIVKAIGTLFEKFADLPPGIQHTIAILGLLVGAAGPVLFVLGKMESSLAHIIEFFARMGGQRLALTQTPAAALQGAGTSIESAAAALTDSSVSLDSAGGSLQVAATALDRAAAAIEAAAGTLSAAGTEAGGAIEAGAAAGATDLAAMEASATILPGGAGAGGLTAALGSRSLTAAEIASMAGRFGGGTVAATQGPGLLARLFGVGTPAMGSGIAATPAGAFATGVIEPAAGVYAGGMASKALDALTFHSAEYAKQTGVTTAMQDTFFHNLQHLSAFNLNPFASREDKLREATAGYAQALKDAEASGMPAQKAQDLLNRAWNSGTDLLGGLSGSVAKFTQYLRSAVGLATNPVTQQAWEDLRNLPDLTPPTRLPPVPAPPGAGPGFYARQAQARPTITPTFLGTLPKQLGASGEAFPVIPPEAVDAVNKMQAAHEKMANVVGYLTGLLQRGQITWSNYTATVQHLGGELPKAVQGLHSWQDVLLSTDNLSIKQRDTLAGTIRTFKDYGLQLDSNVADAARWMITTGHSTEAQRLLDAQLRTKTIGALKAHADEMTKDEQAAIDAAVANHDYAKALGMQAAARQLNPLLEQHSKDLTQDQLAAINAAIAHHEYGKALKLIEGDLKKNGVETDKNTGAKKRNTDATRQQIAAARKLQGQMDAGVRSVFTNLDAFKQWGGALEASKKLTVDEAKHIGSLIDTFYHLGGQMSDSKAAMLATDIAEGKVNAAAKLMRTLISRIPKNTPINFNDNSPEVLRAIAQIQGKLTELQRAQYNIRLNFTSNLDSIYSSPHDRGGGRPSYLPAGGGGYQGAPPGPHGHGGGGGGVQHGSGSRGQALGGIIIRGQEGFVTRGPVYQVGEGQGPTPYGTGAEAVLPLNQGGQGVMADFLSRAMQRIQPGGPGKFSDRGQQSLRQVITDPIVRAIESLRRAFSGGGGGGGGGRVGGGGAGTGGGGGGGGDGRGFGQETAAERHRRLQREREQNRPDPYLRGLPRNISENDLRQRLVGHLVAGGLTQRTAQRDVRPVMNALQERGHLNLQELHGLGSHLEQQRLPKFLGLQREDVFGGKQVAQSQKDLKKGIDDTSKSHQDFTKKAKDGLKTFVDSNKDAQKSQKDTQKTVDDTSKSVDGLTGNIKNVPKDWQTKFDADTDPARSKIDGFISSLRGDTVSINVNAVISQSRHSGGIIAGRVGAPGLGPDETLIKAKIGEFIVNTEDTRANLTALKAINSGKLRGKGHRTVFHDGGTVGAAEADLQINPAEWTRALEQDTTRDLQKMSQSRLSRLFPGIFGIASQVLAAAKTQLGVPYHWGESNPAGDAGGPGAGFDCSGLTMWAASQVPGAPSLVHHADTQYHQLPRTNNPVPGDLAFFSFGRLGSAVDHVGIKSERPGQMVDALHTGAPVEYDPIFSQLVGYGSMGARKMHRGGEVSKFDHTWSQAQSYALPWNDVAAIAHATGYQRHRGIIMAAISAPESGRQPHPKDNVNTNGSRDKGILQYNSVHHLPNSLVYNPVESFRHARNWDLHNWATYNNGTYRPFLHAAERAWSHAAHDAHDHGGGHDGHGNGHGGGGGAGGGVPGAEDQPSIFNKGFLRTISRPLRNATEDLARQAFAYSGSTYDDGGIQLRPGAEFIGRRALPEAKIPLESERGISALTTALDKALSKVGGGSQEGANINVFIDSELVATARQRRELLRGRKG